ncbi:MAG: histidine triad nucleotide-binding protein [Gracilibacteraceae bacterium]|jgi:histidine triad (HIT) family protein|nr:histidine triad nucleotide-binding protein [Gracilibacteraceae bacterium]
MDGCLFCKIVRGEIPSAKVFENDRVLAFKDIHPIAPVHVLVIPKKHLRSLAEAGEDEGALLGELLLVTRDLAVQAGVAETGYRVVTNIGADGAQQIDHLHFHLIGGRKLKARPE